MNGERAGIFDTEDEFDVSGFAPRRRPSQPSSRSRCAPCQRSPIFEAVRRCKLCPCLSKRRIPLIRREPRRDPTRAERTTNIKARAEVIEAFYALADRQGWVLGQAFEHAIAALEHNLNSPE